MSFIFDANKPRQPMTPEQQSQARMQMAMNMPQNVGQGMAALGQAMAFRANQNGAFPTAPGGKMLTGLFGLGARGTGGLY